MLLHTRQTKGTIGVVAVYVYIHSISYDICMSNMVDATSEAGLLTLVFISDLSMRSILLNL